MSSDPIYITSPLFLLSIHSTTQHNSFSQEKHKSRSSQFSLIKQIKEIEMEHQKIEGMAKKIWNLVRGALYMIRKGICKKKILLDLNIMMKRGKLAGKSLRNLMFHHHHHHFSAADLHYAAAAAANPDEYEFSCSNTPLYRPNLFSKRKPHHFDDVQAVNKVLELMVMSSNNDMAASPGLPGLGSGRSPITRQLRITDSPFPLQNDPDENCRVDQAAEDFINSFYSQLQQQQE